MVEITEKGIKLRKNQIDRFLNRLKIFIEDSFRDSYQQPCEEVEFEYKIKS